jgi:hypothetical protein
MPGDSSLDQSVPDTGMIIDDVVRAARYAHHRWLLLCRDMARLSSQSIRTCIDHVVRSRKLLCSHYR